MYTRVLFCPLCGLKGGAMHAGCDLRPGVASCNQCGRDTPIDEQVGGYVWCSGCYDKWRRWMS